MDFGAFDRRRYPTVAPRVGYSEWAATYESSVPALLDLSILEQIRSVEWSDFRQCLDLACGTGRTGRWLVQKGVSTIDGVDLTPEMLAQAKTKNIYRHLHDGSVEHTSLADARYDLLVMCLVDEHLERLEPTYCEAARLSTRDGVFVVIGMHPFIFMSGMPTHFNDDCGRPKAIETHVHLFSHHFTAAKAAGWRLQEAIEELVDDRWLQAKPKWEHLRGFPVNYGYVWNRA
jgi:ubiquinone/menaquinone biosynthesis C-methylase UbiE